MEHDRYHHGDVRATAIAATLELVETGGHGAVTARAVAERVGVTPAALYRHFDGIAGLLADTAGAALERLALALSTAPALPDVARAYLAWALDHPRWFDLCFGPAGLGGDPPHPVFEHGPPAQQVFVARAGTAAEALDTWIVAHGAATLGVDGLLGPSTVPPQVALDGLLVRLGLGDA